MLRLTASAAALQLEFVNGDVKGTISTERVGIHDQGWKLPVLVFLSGSPGFRPIGPEHEIFTRYYEFGDGPPQGRSAR